MYLFWILEDNQNVTILVLEKKNGY
jgi:hypothetical protein